MSSALHNTTDQEEEQANTSIQHVQPHMITAVILDRLNTATDIERRALLEQLRDQLSGEIENGHGEAVINALEHSSGDVQRIALNLIPKSKIQNSASAQVIGSAVLGVLRRATRGVGLPSISTARTCASTFQALSSILNENSTYSFSSSDIEFILNLSSRCLRWNLDDALEGQSSSDHLRRAGPGNAFSFQSQRIGNTQKQGLPGTYRPNSALTTVGKIPSRSGFMLQKKSSSSSLGSFTQSIASAGWDSESAASASERENDSNEGDDRKRLTSAFRAVRSRVIAFLEALNARSAKSLLLHWPELLCESGKEHACLMDIAEIDPAISNRINACHTIEAFVLAGKSLGFFNGAEERSGLSAFTSLSSRIAFTIVQLRNRLVGVLQSTCAIPIKESAIRTTLSLVESTSKVKLRQTHAQVIRPIALRLCSSTETTIAIKAYALLSSLLAGNDDDILTASLGSAQLGDSVLNTLQDKNAPSDIKAQAWKAIAKAAEMRKSPDDSSENEERLQILSLQQLATSTEDVRQAIGSFIFANMSSSSRKKRWSDHIKLLQKDPSPSVKIVAADCLALTGLEGKGLAALCEDEDSSVRAAAFRGIGVAIQKGNGIDEKYKNILRKGLRDSSALVRQRSSWSFGNLCEANSDIEFLSDCMSIRKDDERVSIHIIRGIGVILANSCVSDLEAKSEAVEEALQWINDVITTSKDPKMRWNTCTSIGRIFAMEDTNAMAFLLKLNGELPTKLANILANDKTFKTRLTASTALISLLERESKMSLLPRQVVEDIAQSINIAKQGITKQVENASFREAQLHVIPLEKSIKKLTSLIDEPSIANT